jgi:hypothetical protein
MFFKSVNVVTGARRARRVVPLVWADGYVTLLANSALDEKHS